MKIPIPFVLVVVLSLCVGLVLAYLSWPAPADAGVIRSSRGTVNLQEVKDIGQLRVMRVEVSSLQKVRREGPPRWPEWLRGRDWRQAEVVVPVEVDLGVDLKDLSYQRDGDHHLVRVPPVKVLRKATSFEADHLVVWRDDGNAYQGEGLVQEAAKKGEDAAEGRIGELKMREAAQQQADATVQKLAAAILQVPPEAVKVQHGQ